MQGSGIHSKYDFRMRLVGTKPIEVCERAVGMIFELIVGKYRMQSINDELFRQSGIWTHLYINILIQILVIIQLESLDSEG